MLLRDVGFASDMFLKTYFYELTLFSKISNDSDKHICKQLFVVDDGIANYVKTRNAVTKSAESFCGIFFRAPSAYYILL